MEETSLTDFQDEILEKIFLHLVTPNSWDNLRNLTLVCKRFNHVISSSSKFMKGFNLCWHKVNRGDEVALLNSMRKYREVNFSCHNFIITPTLIEFMRKHSSTISLIYMECATLKSSDLKTIFEIVGANLKTFIIFTLGNYIEDIDAVPMNFPNLESLDFCFETKFYSLLTFFEGTNRIREFLCYGYHSMSEEHDEEAAVAEIPRVGNFLASLVDLKILFLDDVMIEVVFQNDHFANNATCRLEKFEVRADDISSDEIFANILRFLTNQRGSIKILILSISSVITSEIMESLLSLQSLRELSLTCCFRFSQILNVQALSIHKLIFYGKRQPRAQNEYDTAVCEILRCCPNVRDLAIETYKSRNIAVAIANLENLETLTFFGEIYPYSYLNIRTIDFQHSYDYGAIKKMLELNPHLQRIKLPNAMQMENGNNGNKSTFLKILYLVIFFIFCYSIYTKFA